VPDEQRLLEARRAEEPRAVGGVDAAVAVEEQLGVGADLVDEHEWEAVLTAARADDGVAGGVLAERERARGDVDEQLGAGLGERVDRVVLVEADLGVLL